jgi:uncharacterized OB-fold protein
VSSLYILYQENTLCQLPLSSWHEACIFIGRISNKEAKMPKTKNQTKKQPKEDKYAPRKCTKCGEEFTPAQFHPDQLYCSKCSKSKKAKGDYSPRKCERCGKEFTPVAFHPNQRFCKACGKRKGEPKPDFIEKTCEKCGAKFKISKFNPYVTTCHKCQQKAKADKVRDKKLGEIKPEELPDLNSNAFKNSKSLLKAG